MVQVNAIPRINDSQRMSLFEAVAGKRVESLYKIAKRGPAFAKARELLNLDEADIGDIEDNAVQDPIEMDEDASDTSDNEVVAEDIGFGVRPLRRRASRFRWYMAILDFCHNDLHTRNEKLAAFNKMTQWEGETVYEFSLRLQAALDLAAPDLTETEANDRILAVMVNGAISEEVKAKAGSLQTVYAVIKWAGRHVDKKEREQAKKVEQKQESNEMKLADVQAMIQAVLKNTQEQGRAKSGGYQQRAGRAGWNQPRPSRRDGPYPQDRKMLSDMAGLCLSCGDSDHQKRDCPFQFAYCWSCNTQGHIQKVCKKSQRGDNRGVGRGNDRRFARGGGQPKTGGSKKAIFNVSDSE
jgi:hypothetical protein